MVKKRRKKDIKGTELSASAGQAYQKKLKKEVAENRLEMSLFNNGTHRMKADKPHGLSFEKKTAPQKLTWGCFNIVKGFPDRIVIFQIPLHGLDFSPGQQ